MQATAVKEAAQVTAPTKQAPVLMPDRFKLAEFGRRQWTVNAEPGRTPKDLLETSYWTHVAPQMSPFDEVQARADDGKWVAYYVVQYAERNYAKLVLDRVVEFKDNIDAPSASADYLVDWKGAHHGFAVIRKVDSQIVHSGCKTRGEAEAWLKNHEVASRR